MVVGGQIPMTVNNRLLRDPDRPAGRTLMLPAAQLADKPTALGGRWLRVDHDLDELIPEQRGPPRPLGPAAPFLIGLVHFLLPSTLLLIVRTEGRRPTAGAHQRQLVLASHIHPRCQQHAHGDCRCQLPRRQSGGRRRRPPADAHTERRPTGGSGQPTIYAGLPVNVPGERRWRTTGSGWRATPVPASPR